MARSGFEVFPEVGGGCCMSLFVVKVVSVVVVGYDSKGGTSWKFKHCSNLSFEKSVSVACDLPRSCSRDSCSHVFPVSRVR